MKKVLALILVVSCIFTLCSCGLFKKDEENKEPDNGNTNVQPDDGNTNVQPGDGNDDNNQTSTEEVPQIDVVAVAAIQAKIDASAPVTAEIVVKLTAALGDLCSEYDVTYNADGSANVEYTYQKFNSFDLDSDEYVSVYSGNVTVYADGTLSGDTDTASVEALTFDINLDAAKLASAEVTAGVLTATVKAANTASVLGVDLGVDASVVVSTNASVVEFIAISYVSAAGPVEITAMYTYSAE